MTLFALTLSKPAAPTEDLAKQGDIICKATTNAKEGSLLNFKLTLNSSYYYAIDSKTGTVTLTTAGALLVNTGCDLPSVNVTVTSGSNSASCTTYVPATIDVNDAPVLSLSTPPTLTEGTAVAGQIISTASATDEDGNALTFSLTNNPGAVYAINATTGVVTLTTAGALAVNTGNDLPPVAVTVTDGLAPVSKTVNVPITIDVNDAPVLSLSTPPTLTEGTAVAGQVISTASATDEDGDVLTFSLTNNPNAVYAINATTGVVSLTAAGALQVNLGNDLPPVAVTVTDGLAPVSKTVNVPITIDVNDAPVLSLSTPPTLTEGTAVAGQTISTASATDEDGDALTFSLTNNPNAVYAINTTTGVVSLTTAGALVVNTGNDLPPIAVTVSDGIISTRKEINVPTTIDTVTTVTLTASVGSAIENTNIFYKVTADHVVTDSPLVITLSDHHVITIPVGQSSAMTAITVRADVDCIDTPTGQMSASIVSATGGHHQALFTPDAVNTVITWTATIFGSELNDTISTSGINDMIISGAGNDTITDIGGNHRINAGAGNDTITANGGNQIICAGEGNNTVTATGGSHRITSGAGDDTITAIGGNHTIDAGDGNNTITATGGSHVITSGSGNDTITATGGSSLIYGGAGNDTITANGGNEVVFGGAGNDTITTGAGNDRITGGAGADIMTGGAGADVFIFTELGDLGIGAGFRDIITDFLSGTDRLDFSGIDADTNAAGRQAFTMIGINAFSKVAGQLRYDVIGGDTIMQGDVNGDGIVDFELQLTGAHTFVPADLIL